MASHISGDRARIRRSLAAPPAPGDVAVAMTVSGTGVLRATRVLATVDGVSSVQQLDDTE